MAKFRYINRTDPKHPAVMVKDDGTNGVGYHFTHHPSKEKMKATFHKMEKNPDPNDKTDAFLVHKRWVGKIGKEETFESSEIIGMKLHPMDETELVLIEKAKSKGKSWDAYLCWRRKEKATRKKKTKKTHKRKKRKWFFGLF